MNSQQNKDLITRYNADVIEGGDMEAFKGMTGPNFINRSASEGMPAGPEGMIYFFSQILRPAFPDLTVQILDMVAEGNKVATRKTITGSHQGELMGIAPTGKTVTISLIDIFTIEDGLLLEHWGENNLPSVIQALAN